MKKQNKKQNVIISMLITCFCFMTIGYAALSQQLKINGTAKITGNWDIQFTNIVPKAYGGAINKVVPTGIGTTTVTFNVELNEPGDRMEYLITVSNLGNIDAIIESINITSSENDDIIYKVTRIEEGNVLKANETKDFKVIVEYNLGATTTTQSTKTLTVNINYVQQQGSNVTVKEEPEYITYTDLRSLAVTEGDGLYIDETDPGRYIYRGANPDNHIIFNNEPWRILSVESDGTLKIVKSGNIAKMYWDNPNTRNKATSTYCQNASNIGCNAWAATSNLDENPNKFTIYSPNGGTSGSSYSGTVIKDANINTYLNNTYYGRLGIDKIYIVPHDFYVSTPGGSSDEESIATNVEQEKQYIWNGKVGLISVTEYLKTSTNDECTNLKTAFLNNSVCGNNNWLKPGANANYWTISPTANYIRGMIMCISPTGQVYDRYTNLAENVRPVIHLSSDIQLTGSGTSTDKYKIVE